MCPTNAQTLIREPSVQAFCTQSLSVHDAGLTMYHQRCVTDRNAWHIHQSDGGRWHGRRLGHVILHGRGDMPPGLHTHPVLSKPGTKQKCGSKTNVVFSTVGNFSYLNMTQMRVDLSVVCGVSRQQRRGEKMGVSRTHGTAVHSSILHVHLLRSELSQYQSVFIKNLKV